MTYTEQAWHEFSEELRGFVSRRVHEDAAVDDIVQQIFERLHRAVVSDDPPQALRGWLYRVSRNAIIDHFRQTSRQVPGSEDAAALLADTETPDAYAELAPCVNALLSRLPPEDRDALVACDAQGMRQADLAAVLGLSTSGAKSRVQRARAKLRDALAACCTYELSRRGGPIEVECQTRCAPMNRSAANV